jgi:hypothetical protein
MLHVSLLFSRAVGFFTTLSFGSALQALLKTLVEWRLVRFLIVLAKCVGYAALIISLNIL